MADNGRKQKKTEPGPFFDEAVQIEKSLYELADGITDPELANTIVHIIDAFENKKKAIADLAYRDDKTVLFNNVYFTGRLLEEVSRGLRYRRELSLLIIELGASFLDKFPDAAAAILETLRRSDTCARIEGMVFAALLPETASKQAERVAEKLLNSIQPFGAEGPADAWVGIADLTADRNNALKLESAAYHAKDRGKEKNLPVSSA